MLCRLCPNDCGAERAQNPAGLCAAPEQMIIARIAPHFFEEPPISGTRGSGTVFFGGCTMRCAFCQNAQISRAPKGKRFSPSELAAEIERLEAIGVHNINFVTPTHYTDKIIETLSLRTPSVPVVWNTSGYEKRETIAALSPYVKVWLPDMKYSDDTLGLRLSGRKNYPETALAAIEEMLKKPSVYQDGLIKQGVIIRHLILPGYVENSFGVLERIKERFGASVTLSLMSQFTPMPFCKDPGRKLLPIEYKAVLARAKSLGFTDIWTQESASASEEFIPEWDLFD